MTSRVIENVEQYNRDMFKLQDDNANTPPVGVRQFRNPFMQQSVNALLTAILAKGTGKGADAVPVSSMSPGDLATAESEEAAGVFRRPDKTGKKVRRPEGEERGERVGKASGNIKDTEQEELSEKAKAAGEIAAKTKPAVKKDAAALKKIQDDLLQSKAKLTAESMTRQTAIKTDIAELDRASAVLEKLNTENKKALIDAKSSKPSNSSGRRKKVKRIAKLDEQLADNTTRLKKILREEKPAQQAKLAAEVADLSKKKTVKGVLSAAKQKVIGEKLKKSKESETVATTAASAALSKAKGLSKSRTAATAAADKTKAAAKAKKDAKEADAKFKKSLAEDAAKAKAAKAKPSGFKKSAEAEKANMDALLASGAGSSEGAKARSRSGSGSSSDRRRSKTPSTFAKPTSSTQREADKHTATKVKEKERQVFQKKDEKAAAKHKTKTDAATAKETAKASTTASRKAALQTAQLATLNSYMKISALDAANPNVSNGNYLFRVNAQTASRAEIKKERKDWSAWYTARQKLFSAYEKDKAKQNALLAKQPTTRDGGVRGSGTRAGAVETGGGKQPTTRDGGVRGSGTRAGAVETGGGN
jgi:hypothetical protein